MFELESVTSEAQIKEIAEIAEPIWHETYDALGTVEIVDAMVKALQSEPAIKKQIETGGYHYYMLKDGVSAGFLGLVPENEDEKGLYLSKAYIKSEYRGKGAFSLFIEKAVTLAKEYKKEYVYLYVNKLNERAISVYKRYGFEIVGEKVTNGDGYVMDDYLLKYYIN